ncbi:retrovirus-related pol polyprotein from transposon TNT 1-94 [Tanacetum coccineum]|uniref:Retrovirus-related pol polyprotein from transposon TNT 1-94 n=1 Tax=Tanacetum coccineum TaxID=301880 RepID=A0ABQ5AF74_9ASTR
MTILRLARLLSTFHQDFSKIAKPLTSLTQKNSKYEGGMEKKTKEETFQTLKDKLCNAPILSLPDGPEDFVVYCDASNQGLGCILMQSRASEIRYHPRKTNVEADALCRKERVKPRRLRANIHDISNSDGRQLNLDVVPHASRQMRMVGANGGNQFRQYAGQNGGYQNGYNAVQNVGNHVVQDAVQNQGVQNIGNQNGQIVVPGITNQNPNGNGNVVAARAEGNATGNNGNQIRCYNCRGLGHLARNCTVRPRRRDAASLRPFVYCSKGRSIIQLQAEEFDFNGCCKQI